MKKLILFYFILLSFFTFHSYAEWTKITENIDGDAYYIDFDNIKENNGYLYFWYLRDYPKPDEFNDMSSKILKEVDCNIPTKGRIIYSLYYTSPMGAGQRSTSSDTASEWMYASPDSVFGTLLDIVCNY